MESVLMYLVHWARTAAIGSKHTGVYAHRFKLRWVVLCLLAVALSSCSVGEHEPPYRSYDAQFTPSADTVRIAQGFLNELAEERSLLIDNYSHHVSVGSEPDHPAFSAFMFHSHDANLANQTFLWVTHTFETLGLVFFFRDDNDMTLAQLDGLIEEIKGGLEERLDIQFCQREHRKTVCAETKTPLLRYKARYHPDMKKIFTEDQRYFPELFHVMWAVADQWPNLRANPFTVDVERITGRSDAIEAMLFFELERGRQRKRVLDIGNEDDGAIVKMNLYGGNGLSDDEVGRLASQTIDALESRFGTPFCRANVWTDLCDAEHAHIETQRERRLEASQK